MGPDERFKFVDDLTVLEIVNLLTVGLTSYNMKHHVPSDIPEHGQFLSSDNLKSQSYLDQINDWTLNKQMKINESKTKIMIFNPTKNYQFTTRIKLNHINVEVVNEAKLLGTYITDDLKWDLNTQVLVKKAYSRMQLLRKVAEFSDNVQDLKLIYIIFIRSLLEQSCIVWQSMISQENKDDLERVQKCSLKLVLKGKFQNYQNALNRLELLSLDERRQNLSRKFAIKNLNCDKMETYFQDNLKTHIMKTRHPEQHNVTFAHTQRLKDSPIIYMQGLLNEQPRNGE